MSAGHFLVTTPGYTASKWLAWALHEHPDIYCTHSGAYVAAALDRDYTLAELDEVVSTKRTVRAGVPLDAYFARLRAAAPRRLYGNVHLFSARLLAQHARRWPPATPFVAVNVVRHPVLWVASGARQLERMCQGVETTRLQLQLHAAEQRQTYDELLGAAVDRASPPVLAFCYLCHELTGLVDDALAAPRQPARMEDLTTSPEHLAALVQTLSGGAVAFDEARARRAISRGPLHRHRAAALPVEAEVASWQGWQRRVFAHWAALAGLAAVYGRYGYELPALTP